MLPLISTVSRQFKLDCLGSTILVVEPSLDDGTQVNFDRIVGRIAAYPRLGLQFQKAGRKNWSNHRAIDDHVRHMHLTFNARMFTNHQGARLIIKRAYVPKHLAIYTQSARKRMDFGIGLSRPSAGREASDSELTPSARPSLDGLHVCHHGLTRTAFVNPG
mgnify:CR=1 FL=1